MKSITTRAAEPRQTIANNEGKALLTTYKPISYAEVRQEVLTLMAVAAASLKEWRREESMYEQTVTRTGETPVVVPRRNCLTSDGGEVRDPELFPYHTACYPLLDAYEQRIIVDWEAYREGTELVWSTDFLVAGNTRNLPFREMDVSGHLPCSIEALEISLGILLYSDNEDILEDEWNNGLQKRLKSHDNPEFYFQQEELVIHQRFGISFFPPEADAKADLLLKILRHALSDLQKDYRLARAVIRRLSKWKLCQNADCLRRVLSIIGTRLADCDGYCFERFLAGDQQGEIPDHSCVGWKSFETSLSGLLSTGIEYITSEHALVISSVVLFTFDRLNPAAAELEASLMDETLNPKKQSVEDKQRSLLKHKLFILKNTNYESEMDEDDDDEEEGGEIPEETKTDWIDEIVLGLGTQGSYARKRILQLRDRLMQRANEGQGLAETDVFVVLLRKSIDSFFNCARCLVIIGEAALRRLPNNRYVVGFCSRLVLCLTQMFVEPNPDFLKYRFDRTYLLAGRSLIDPSRYADSILNATRNYRQRHFPVSSTMGIENETIKQAIDEADTYLRTPPHRDVTDLIHCFFAKDLVDVSIARCGYGDIQIWWNLPVTPLDPFLFFETCHSPRDDVLNGVPWATDEVGSELWGDRLNARHDFSLVLLLRAWNSPWTVNSHHSFQKPFREVVKTLLLCANRIRMPTDIATHVSSYLRRDWWPDERSQCWYEECLTKGATQLLDQKLLQKDVSDLRPQKSFHFCRECHVALYCSHGCARGDWRGGHKPLCGKPPYRIPGLEEDQLFQDVLTVPESALGEQMRQFLASRLGQHEEINVYDDDSGSWESMDSDDDDEAQSETVTEIVFRFFDKLSYRSQRAYAAQFTDGVA